MKTVITYIVLGILALGLLFLFVSSFEYDNRAELEEQIWDLEMEIEDLKSVISDMEDESVDYYWSATEAKGYLGYAEECLTGFFGSIDVEEALSGVQLAMECLDEITS